MVVEEVTLEQRPKGNEGTSHADILKREGLCQQVQAEIFECPKNTLRRSSWLKYHERQGEQKEMKSGWLGSTTFTVLKAIIRLEFVLW